MQSTIQPVLGTSNFSCLCHEVCSISFSDIFDSQTIVCQDICNWFGSSSFHLTRTVAFSIDNVYCDPLPNKYFTPVIHSWLNFFSFLLCGRFLGKWITVDIVNGKSN